MKKAYWVGVSVAPVQPFIEAARSVRDLKVGSSMLSELARATLKRLEEHGAELLLPKEYGENAHIPNRFTVAYSTRELALEGAALAERTPLEIWRTWGELVHTDLNANLEQAFPNWDHGWTEQIDRYWHVRTAIVGEGDIEEAEVHFPEGAAARFAAMWWLLGAALDVQKQVRTINTQPPFGRPKCTLFGDLEQMGPGGRISAHNRFWRHGSGIKQTSLARRQIWKDSDRLSAVALVKRGLPYSGSDAVPQRIRNLSTRIRDTREIALAKFEQERKRNIGATERPQPRYLAVLKLDGDRIGRHLHNCKSVDELRELSGKILAFATKAESILTGQHAEIVYSGGDDVLALLPALQALPAAKRVREELGQIDPKLTASAGIAIFHYKHDLRIALEHARNALEKAKDSGRDMIGWEAMKRSGAPLVDCLSWDLVESVQHLAEQFEAGASVRWAYHVERLAEDLYDTAPLDVARLLVNHHIARMAEAAEDDSGSDVAKCATKLLDGVADSLRREMGRQQPGSDLPPERQSGYAIRVMKRFNALTLLAAFLVRGESGREEDTPQATHEDRALA